MALGSFLAPSDRDLATAEPIEHHRLLLRAELVPRHVEVDFARLGDGVGDAKDPTLAARHRRSPGRDSALSHRELPIGHHEIRVDLLPIPEPIARLAHPEGAIEREALRRRLRKTLPAARSLLAELELLAGGRRDAKLARPLAQRELDRFGEPNAFGFAQRDAVDDEQDGVFALLVERRRVVEVMDLAVDHHASETARFQVEQKLSVFALSMRYERRQERELRTDGKAKYVVRDLFRRLRANRLATNVTMLLADFGVEHAKVVVDLGDRAHGRSRVARRALLLDSDGRREAAQVLHARALELPQELSRVRGQRLDVATLPLGVERVEGEARFARPAHAREDHELALRNLEPIDVEVVLARAEHLDVVRVLGGSVRGSAFGRFWTASPHIGGTASGTH